MRILALDVGDKRIGLAKTDGLGIGVWPLKTLVRQNLEKDWKTLLEILEEDQIEKVIVGLPLHQNGKESSQSQKIRGFVKAFEKFLRENKKPIPFEFWDERLSSWEAEENLNQAHIKIKGRKGVLDAEAACVLLKDYLSEQKQGD